MLSINGRTYKMGPELGSGTYGIVYTIYRDDKQEFAFKNYINSEYPSSLELGALREISILKMLQFEASNNGIIVLHDIILQEDSIGIVIPKYKLDLQKAIEKDILSNKQKHNICQKLLESLCFLHSKNILHRDIKPDNIMLDNNYNPILADYTLAKVFDGLDNEETHTGNIATITYRPPEVVAHDNYSFPVDAWSLGVAIYEMYTNNLISTKTDKETLVFLAQEIMSFKDNTLGHMLKGLLDPNPDSRMTPEEALVYRFKKEYPHHLPLYIHNTSHVSDEINTICDNLDIVKHITRQAAQVYVNTTECNMHMAVSLAYKFYETEARDIDYDTTDLEILCKMDYNLFV